MSNDEYDQTRMTKQADDAFLSFEHLSSFDSRYSDFVVLPGVSFWRLFFLTGTSSSGATSYSGFEIPISQWSNQPTMCRRRSTLRDGCGKAARLSHYPVRQQSAAASAGYAKFLIVDVTAFDGCIQARHQIFVIVTRVAILNDVPKFLSVTGAAAWIRI